MRKKFLSFEHVNKNSYNSNVYRVDVFVSLFVILFCFLFFSYCLGSFCEFAIFYCVFSFSLNDAHIANKYDNIAFVNRIKRLELITEFFNLLYDLFRSLSLSHCIRWRARLESEVILREFNIEFYPSTIPAIN